MEKARCNTELYSNLREPHNNVKPSNFWGSHQFDSRFYYIILFLVFTILLIATFHVLFDILAVLLEVCFHLLLLMMQIILSI